MDMHWSVFVILPRAIYYDVKVNRSLSEMLAIEGATVSLTRSTITSLYSRVLTTDLTVQLTA
jgi:hypothetical protein